MSFWFDGRHDEVLCVLGATLAARDASLPASCDVLQFWICTRVVQKLNWASENFWSEGRNC